MDEDYSFNDFELNERCEKLGFKPQKEIIFNRLLPYAHKLDDESLRLFADIKGNLGRSLMLREYRPGFGIWISRLNKYIKVYGLKFSKEDHIALIKLLLEALLIPDLEPSRVYKISNSLLLLLKKHSLISPDELEIPWRPLCELHRRIITRNETNLGMYRYFATLDNTITCLIEDCKIYFPATATQEILDEWRPKLCPFNTQDMCQALESLMLFLPMNVQPQYGPQTYNLWLKEILDLWDTCHNSPPWENTLMWMVARVASGNIGYIDWEPTIPIMFTRFLRSLDLPVSYKGYQNGKSSKIDISAMSLWIVSVLQKNSCAMTYLQQFMCTIESYYHHANQGRWGGKLKALLKKLPFDFIERLHKERYAKKKWNINIPEEHKLTEECITNFVEALLPAVTFSIYGTLIEVTSALQNLSLLRPAIVIPVVLEKLYSTLGSLTEPHKLTASMMCVVSTARSLVEGARLGYPEGPTHVVPLLMALLPGIDPNDIRKCLVTFQFISTFASLVPIVDSSNAADYHTDLTEEEHVICEATAQFEDFVLQFMDKVFTMIESSALELTRLEQADTEKKSRLESVAESALSSICASLLMQTSPAIFKSALRKMDAFLKDKIMEIKVSGPLVAIMVRSFVRVNPKEVIKILLPRFCENILNGLKDTDKKEENLDNEILFNLLLLSEVVYPGGRALLPYEQLLMDVLDKTLWLTCRQAAYSAHCLLGRILSSLSTIGLVEYRSSPVPYDTPVKDFLPIREWGKPGNINNLNIQYFVPDEEELQCIKNFIWRYLPIELRRLELHIAGNNDESSIKLPDGNEITSTSADNNVELQREELHRSLGVILALMNCKTLLPLWSEEPIALLDTKVDISPMELEIGCPGVINMPDGSNIRKTVAQTIGRLQDKILDLSEGDTKSLFHLITIWNTLLLNKGNGDRGFEAHWKHYHNIKRVMENRLTGCKRHLRWLLVDRVMLQHELRIEASVQELTQTHVDILKRLFQLSISSYSEVRAQAQSKLLTAISHFPYSYTILIPEIKKILELDSNENHEQFKGALYILLGPKTVPLIARHDWTLINQIWPTLVNSKLSEKPSVINLVELLVETVHKHFPTITIDLTIPDSCIDIARTMWTNQPIPKQSIANSDEIMNGVMGLERAGEKNMSIYLDTVNKILDSIEFGNLHWRYKYMAYNFLRDLVHPDVKYSARVVRCFFQTLIHDSLELRKLNIRTSLFVLKQQKRSHKKLKIHCLPCKCSKEHECTQQLNACMTLNEIICTSTNENIQLKPGDRLDNRWLQYDSKKRPLNEADWEKPCYLHKEYYGYYTWPKILEMYAPTSEQPTLDRDISELNEQELEVHKFFSNADNVDKLIGFLSMEEKKGKDKFSGFRFIFFKNLFRNHGDTFLPMFLPHIKRLVTDKQEQHQRCAAELIAALIRGCKHWPFNKVKNLWKELDPIIRTALSNMTVETTHDWGICFATAAEGRDPNRYHWLYEILMDNPLRDEASFIECGRLYALQGALNQQEWRVAELHHRLWLYFKNYLTHPFQNVRDRLSSVLTNITEADIQFPGGNRTISPRVEQIIEEVEPKLNILYNSGLKDFHHIEGATNLGNGDSSNVVASPLVDEGATCKIDNMKLTDDEKDTALRLMKTVFKWIVSVLSRMQYSSLSPFYKLFGLACFLQSHENDEDVAKTCTQFLAMLAQALHPVHEIDIAIQHIRNIALPSPSWSARVAVTRFIQSFVFYNMSLILSNDRFISEIKDIVLILLKDEALDVRTIAEQVLSGLLHCNFIPKPEDVLQEFLLKAKTRVKKRSKISTNITSPVTSSSLSSKNTENSVQSMSDNTLIDKSQLSTNKQTETIRLRHAAILGLCAFIDAHPYDVPAYIPDIFSELGNHLNDPQPIPSTIRKTLGDFKRTHHDNWEIHKLKFTEEQLAVLTDLSVPPSYYA